MTPDLQKMAAQLASLGDGDPAKQAELLAKALGGSAKAGKALGVQLPKGGTALQNYKALMAKLAPQLDKATSGQASLADIGERWDATLANLQLQLAGFLEKLAPVASSSWTTSSRCSSPSWTRRAPSWRTCSAGCRRP